MALWTRLRNLLRRREADAAFFAELESTLFSADVGPDLTAAWMKSSRKWKRSEDVERVLTKAMAEALAQAPVFDFSVARDGSEPAVVMIVGVNGVGKTTTIAKLAHRWKAEGAQPLLVAADTFRAAAIEQLQVWGTRLELPVIAQKLGSDAAAVAFDGITAAVARNCHPVLVDTAGRLHTKAPLMDELQKVKRVMGKARSGAPHACWCVIDAMIGQNAIAQIATFHETLGLTGLVVTKLDGTAKAGALFTIAQQFQIPIGFTGHGESPEDLRPFSAPDFIAGLLANS
jgi:fused signal recognition particle receptor